MRETSITESPAFPTGNLFVAVDRKVLAEDSNHVTTTVSSEGGVDDNGVGGRVLAGGEADIEIGVLLIAIRRTLSTVQDLSDLL